MQSKIKEIWSRPILKYTQTEVIALVMFLSQQLNDIPNDCVVEYRFVFEMLVARIGILLLRKWPASILDYNEKDDPTMRYEVEDGAYMVDRHFLVFISFYMGAIMQRLVYQDHFLTHQIRIDVGRVRKNVIRRGQN